MLQYVVPAVLGLIAGVIGSLVAPWVQWAVERQRGRDANRLAMIEACRKALLQADALEPEDLEYYQPFGATVEYTRLRPHLDRKFREQFESGRVFADGAQGRHSDGHRNQLLDALASLERKWGLI